MKFTKSNLTSSLTLAALVICAFFIVLSLNSNESVTTVVPIQGKGNAIETEAGALVVSVLTNQNPRDPFADPGSLFFRVANKSITITNIDNSTLPPQVVVTNALGFALTALPPANYSVTFDEQPLHVSIPVKVLRGNVTRTTVRIRGEAYHVAYAEISNVGLGAAAVRNSFFALIHSPLPVANVDATLLVKTRGPGPGHLSNATVVGEQLTGSNLWLKMTTPDAFDPLNASTMVLQVYNYTYSVAITPPTFLSAP